MLILVKQTLVLELLGSIVSNLHKLAIYIYILTNCYVGTDFQSHAKLSRVYINTLGYTGYKDIWSNLF